MSSNSGSRNHARTRLLAAGIAALVVPAAWATPSTVVHVDDGGGATGFEFRMDAEKVPAGDVRFVVSNPGKSLEHEFVIARTTAPADALPYDSGTQLVDEGELDVVGEVEDLGPGNSGDAVFALAPGHYVAFCNEAGHYKAGMFEKFEVE